MAVRSRGIIALPVGGRLLRPDPWTPASLGGSLDAWWEVSPEYVRAASDGSGVEPTAGTAIGYVEDLSGNANHLTQATETSKPVLRQDVGGNYYLEFDGTDDFLSFGPIASATERHIAMVSVDDSGGTGTTVLFSPGSDQYVGTNATPSWITFFSGDGSKVAGPASAKSYVGLTQDASGFILDGGGTETTGGNAISSRNYEAIGRFTSSTGLYWNGGLYNAAFCANDKLDAAQRLQLKNYLKNKAGV